MLVLSYSARGATDVTRILDRVQHAFLWEEGLMVDLHDHISANSGWVLTQETTINDDDQIAGFGLHSGAVRAFLPTPVDNDQEDDED